MRILKRTYIQPQTEVIDFDNEGMICSSVEPNASNAIQVDDTPTIQVENMMVEGMIYK